MNIKNLVWQFLIEAGKPELLQYLEYPTDSRMGDVALPCFILAKELKLSPMQIAENLAEELQWWEHISKVLATGPYVNITMDWSKLGVELITDIEQEKENYWRTNPLGSAVSPLSGGMQVNTEKILVESPWPNTNKPLHLWHVRNMLLGNSVADILSFAGYDVHRVDIVNDRGIHICKSMLAYQKLWNGAEPNKKSDHYVWSWYVAYDAALKENPEWEIENQEMLRKREDGDQEIRDLWKTMNKWCLDGHAITYERYGTIIEKTYLESDHYLAGKDMVLEWLDKGLFRENEKWNIVADLSNEQEKVVLRSDGTSIYLTQDLALGKVRYEDYHMDRMIYVVGNEQNDHFKALFEIFGQLWYEFADQCYHLSYGMIALPDGKMKSRTGNVVDADNLADDMTAQCVDLLVERYPELDMSEVERRAEIIAMAAIKMFVLKYDASKNFVFDKESSLAFDGETGPYVLYTYARAKTILSKVSRAERGWKKLKHAENEIQQVSQDEQLLLASVARFGEMVQEAADQYAPTIIAKFVLWLASDFNSYYHHTKILDETVDETTTQFRLGLVVSVAQVLHNGLKLLGIETLEQM